MSFPKIKGLRWLDPGFPDLVAVAVTLVDRDMKELDIPGMKLPEMPSEIFIDLSKLAAVHPWFPKGSDDPSEKVCSVDICGVDNFLADMAVKDLTEAWIFYKRFKYAHDTRNS